MNGLVKEIRWDMMIVSEVKSQVKEMFLLGGQKLVPILQWDEIKISERKGPLATKLQDFLFALSQGDRAKEELTSYNL